MDMEGNSWCSPSISFPTTKAALLLPKVTVLVWVLAWCHSCSPLVCQILGRTVLSSPSPPPPQGWKTSLKHLGVSLISVPTWTKGSTSLAHAHTHFTATCCSFIGTVKNKAGFFVWEAHNSRCRLSSSSLSQSCQYKLLLWAKAAFLQSSPCAYFYYTHFSYCLQILTKEQDLIPLHQSTLSIKIFQTHKGADTHTHAHTHYQLYICISI